MSWNYRVVRQSFNDGDHTDISYEIHEAYYNKAGEVCAITEKGVSVYGESIDEIKEVLLKMQIALEKDIINLDTFVFAKSDSSEEDTE